jgi:hypothetical protein
MRLNVENPYGLTSPNAIAQFEARRGVLLPAEYKAFLLKSNGGCPTPNVFESDAPIRIAYRASDLSLRDVFLSL